MHKKLKNLIDSYQYDINILQVEDCKNTVVSTKNILSKYFTNIYSAFNGEDGLNLVKNGDIKYDIIITDLDMPIRDGISMIKEIRKFNQNIYIVIFSVQSDSEYFIETINIGINGYILKPFKLSQFIDMSIKFIEHLNLTHPINIDTNLVSLIENYQWNKKDFILIKDSVTIKLTANEIKLFKLLGESLGTYASDELSEYIFEEYSYKNSNKLRNLLAKLKNKLGLSLIDSLYGIGYKLKIDTF